VGFDPDIIKASVDALVVAVNRLSKMRDVFEGKDPRLVEILNYIQANYKTVTLEELSEKFYLSKPYLSKYIKEKSGMTFVEYVKRIRMAKAQALLKSGNMTVEKIAYAVGYQNVEHFNRLFKESYHLTPSQYRKKENAI
ncbi:MAG: helix-turn-helix domain-containing protein, partial [Desulfitobacterium sp.]|nr:helix-turn-helix domain-containing protein [Desulfitobacterium sp.]